MPGARMIAHNRRYGQGQFYARGAAHVQNALTINRPTEPAPQANSCMQAGEGLIDPRFGFLRLFIHQPVARTPPRADALYTFYIKQFFDTCLDSTGGKAQGVNSVFTAELRFGS